jgi:hypothetical protein
MGHSSDRWEGMGGSGPHPGLHFRHSVPCFDGWALVLRGPVGGTSEQRCEDCRLPCALGAGVSRPAVGACHLGCMWACAAVCSLQYEQHTAQAVAAVRHVQLTRAYL